MGNGIWNHIWQVGIYIMAMLGSVARIRRNGYGERDGLRNVALIELSSW